MNLLSILNSYGDIVELDYKFSKKTIDELEKLIWMIATHGKRAINLTGPEMDLGLESKDKHDENQQYNSNLKQCPSIIEFFDKWENLARCRAVLMNKGSFFKLHRDAYGINPQFRIFIPLNKTNTDQFCFIYDDKLVKFKPGVPYILNTRKSHGSFAMEDQIYHILMSVYLTDNNLKTVSKLLPNTSEL